MPRDKGRIVRNIIEMYQSDQMTFQEALKEEGRRSKRRSRGGSFGGSGGLAGEWTGEHHELNGMLDDDHVQYMHNTVDRNVSATHTFKANVPFAIDNDTMITNLNADKLDGYHESSFFRLNQNETVTGAPSFNGGISGASPPFVVDSTFLVSNLNADLWDDKEFADYIDQAVKVDSSPTHADLTLSSPSAIYGLSHDSFTDFVSNEHIDWTSTTQNFLTTGTLGSGAITADGLIKGTTTNAAKLQLHEDSTNYVTFNVTDGGELNIYPTGAQVSIQDGKQFGGSSFVSGFAGSGWRISYDDSSSEYTAELDNLTIRGTMSVYELLIQQIRATNGSLIIGSADKVESASQVSGARYKFTIESDGGNDFIHFTEDDLILAQKWSGTSNENEGGGYDAVKRVRATVDETSLTVITTQADCATVDTTTEVTHSVNAAIIAGLQVIGAGIPVGTRIDTITDDTHFELDAAATATATVELTFKSTLSADEFEATLYNTDTVSDSDLPLDFVRIGNTSDTDRQGGIYLTADDSGAPFIDIFDGVAAWTDWRSIAKTKARLGRLDGVTYDSVSLDGYGLWSENVYLTGKITATSGYIGDTSTGWAIDANGFTNVGTTSATRIGIGTGGYANSGQKFWVDGSGQFSLGDKLTWSGTALSIKGTIQLTNGTELTGAGMNWLGVYAAGTTYAVNDGVSYLSASYICTAISIGNLPTDTDYWDLMADQGADGDVYATTSSTSIAIPTSHPTSISITIEDSLAYTIGQSIIIANDDTHKFTGTVTSYDSGTGVMDVDSVTNTGTGTFASWEVNLEGAPGPQGDTGTTYYTWIKYGTSSAGANLVDSYTAGTTTYIGMAFQQTSATESTTASNYTWSLLEGTDGTPGTTYYTWVKYGTNAIGDGLTDTYTAGTTLYIGMAFQQTSATESTTAGDYEWSLIEGTDGIPGTDGDVFKQFFIYQNATSAPSTPTLGAVSSSGVLTPNTNESWTSTSSTPAAGNYTWISSSVWKQTEGTGNFAVDTNWSTASQISGATGDNGVDARAIVLTPSQHTINYSTAGVESTSITFSTAAQNTTGTLTYEFQVEGTVKQAYSVLSTFALADADEPAIGGDALVKVTLKEDSSIVASDSVTIYAIQDGSNATTIIVSNEGHTLPVDVSGNVTYTGSGTDIKVWSGSTALAYGTGNSQFTVALNADTNITVDDDPSTVSIYTRRYGDHSAMDADTASITYDIIVNDAASSATTFIKTQTFAKSHQGSTGQEGNPGQFSKTIYLNAATAPSNPANTGGTYGTPAAPTSWLFTVSTPSTGEYTWHCVSDYTYTGGFQGWTVPARHSGEVGEQGGAGVNARAIILTPNQYTIIYGTDDAIVGSNISFTTSIQGLVGTATYLFAVDGVVKQAASTLSSYAMADSLRPAIGGEIQVQVKFYDNTVEKANDTVTIYSIQDGSDTISAFLTNASHTVSANVSGTVSDFTGAGGTHKIFVGALDVTTSCTHSVNSETGVDVSIVSGTGIYSAASMSASNGTATFRAVIPAATAGSASDVTVDSDYSISKSQTGATGDDNQDFDFLEDVEDDIPDVYNGLMVTSDYMGYVTRSGGGTPAWHTYMDNTGKFYFKSTNTSNVLSWIDDALTINASSNYIGFTTNGHADVGGVPAFFAGAVGTDAMNGENALIAFGSDGKIRGNGVYIRDDGGSNKEWCIEQSRVFGDGGDGDYDIKVLSGNNFGVKYEGDTSYSNVADGEYITSNTHGDNIFKVSSYRLQSLRDIYLDTLVIDLAVDDFHWETNGFRVFVRDRIQLINAPNSTTDLIFRSYGYNGYNGGAGGDGEAKIGGADGGDGGSAGNGGSTHYLSSSSPTSTLVAPVKGVNGKIGGDGADQVNFGSHAGSPGIGGNSGNSANGTNNVTLLGEDGQDGGAGASGTAGNATNPGSGGAVGSGGSGGSSTQSTTKLEHIDPHLVTTFRDLYTANDTAQRIAPTASGGSGGSGGGGGGGYAGFVLLSGGGGGGSGGSGGSGGTIMVCARLIERVGSYGRIFFKAQGGNGGHGGNGGESGKVVVEL